MTASSNINSQLIDNTFPIPNKSQSSQGFRTNWAAIQSNFNYAKSDILNLQNKTLAISGDVIGTSSIFDSGTTEATVSVTLQPTGLQDLQPGTYSTSISTDVSFTVDNRGLITYITNTPSDTIFPIEGNIEAKSSLDSLTSYPGITSINIPTISYNKYGQITEITDNIIYGFGITDLEMPQNTILYGNSNNTSSFLTPPSVGSILSYDENTNSLKWIQSLVISQFSSGNLISTVYDNTLNTVTVGLDYSKASETSDIDYNALICIYDGTDYNLAKISTISSNITDSVSSNIKIINDKAPQLGGDLDTNGFSIVDTKTSNVTISSKDITLSSTDPVNINGILLPVTLPTEDSILSIDKTGNITYENSSNYNINMFNDLITYNLVTNQIVTLNSSISLNYFLLATNITGITLLANTNNYSTNTNYNLKISIFLEVTGSDLILNFSAENSNNLYLNGNGVVTSLILDQGYIYKLELEYYSNSKWLVNVPFKSSLS